MPAKPAPWEIHYEPDTERVEVTPGIAVPARFSYTVTPADQPLSATVHMHIHDGLAVCDRVEVERRDGEPLTAQAIRTVPFGQLITEAPQVAAMARRSGPIRVGDRAGDHVGERALQRVREAVTRKAGIPVDLADVRDVYRAALVAGRPPTAEVADAFNMSPRTASRRVADARAAGLLGEALERRAGEKVGA
jgi:hypothetical protein